MDWTAIFTSVVTATVTTIVILLLRSLAVAFGKLRWILFVKHTYQCKIQKRHRWRFCGYSEPMAKLRCIRCNTGKTQNVPPPPPIYAVPGGNTEHIDWQRSIERRVND